MGVILAKAQKFDGEAFEPVEDYLTEESALQIMLNDEPFTVTMRTPGSDFELTRGLLFTEDIAPIDVTIEMSFEQNRNSEISIVKCQFENAPQNRTTRSLLSASSCGLCGTKELKGLDSGIKLKPSSPFDIHLLPAMFDQMQAHQKNFKQSGGCHAAAAFNLEGFMLNCYEDIGRHNAVDKVIGDLILTGRLSEVKCLLVSGRLSYEIVSKAAKASIPFLIAVSAPSSLSVEMANRMGMTLIAFCRDNRATVYSHIHQVKDCEYAL